MDPLSHHLRFYICIEFDVSVPLVIPMVRPRWGLYLWIFALILPLVLILIQFLTIWGILPYQWFALNIRNPVLSSLFLNPFIHAPDNMMHIAWNISMYLGTILLIVVVYFSLLPKIRGRTNGYPLGYSENCFFAASAIYLTAGPILLSLMILAVGPYFKMTYMYGFSGIAYCFLGYLFWLVISLLAGGYLSKPDWNSRYRPILEKAISAGISVFVVVIISLEGVMSPTICVPAHIVGFLVGILTAVILNNKNHDRYDHSSH